MYSSYFRYILVVNLCSYGENESEIILLADSNETNGEMMPCARILEQSMGARSRVRIGLSYRPAQKQFTEDPASECSNILVWFGSHYVLPSP